MQVSVGIGEAEFAARRERLQEHLSSQGARGFVLFDEHYIGYFTGFRFLATERPVAVVGTLDGEMAAFVPEFEVERVRAETTFERIESYPEYPGKIHPMRLLGGVLRDMGIGDRIGADTDGYPGILGYQGPALSQVTGAQVVPLASSVEGMMRCKSAAEIACIRESARWCGVAHRLLQRYSQPGTTEVQGSLRAGMEATLDMLETLGPGYVLQKGSSDGATAGYRGQIGRRSAWAHAVAHNITFAPGDILVSETSAPVCGYHAELERAMVIGPPTNRMRSLFDHMLAMQEVAFAAIRPGVTCAGVDGAVTRYLEEHHLTPYWRQHTGHAIGLRNHEAPFLDLGDWTPIEPGMVFTVEPGLYDPDVGGFRHSDTVAVTPDGIDVLTAYPRDLESLTIAV